MCTIPAALQQAIARPLAALARRRGYSADPAGLAELTALVVSEERSAVLSGGSRPLSSRAAVDMASFITDRR
jgi:hypothetical protein